MAKSKRFTPLFTAGPLLAFLLCAHSLAEEVPVHTGTALEVRNAGNYTYLEVQEGAETYWIATPHTMVPKGSVVRFDEQVWMYDFPSKVLNRTFDKVLFVGGIEIISSPDEGEAPAALPEPATPVSLDVVTDAGALAIADVHDRKGDLAGQRVTVTGRVVKILDKIMGSSWLHIEDASSPPSNHIVVRVAERQVEVGARVSATGVLRADVDYGYGYFYPILIEGAAISAQPD